MRHTACYNVSAGSHWRPPLWLPLPPAPLSHHFVTTRHFLRQALDDALDKWAAKMLSRSLAVAKTDLERNAMHRALGKGRFGLRLDQIMKKCKKLGVMSSVHLINEEDQDRMEELERYSSDER